MLRMIFTLVATLALLLAGSVWLAAQPSGGDLRQVMVPVVNRGLVLAERVSRRFVPGARPARRGAADGGAARVPLTPTASGVWEPDAEAPPPEPDPRPTLPEVEPRPDPEVVEEEILAVAAPFRESPAAEPGVVAPAAPSVAPPSAAEAGPPSAPEQAAAPALDQDEWAALIRRMLVVHGRVSGAR
jgi:hypothetical protein